MIVPSLRAKRRARIEIIPLIDIVFFLLATFVMVSLSMVKDHGVSVNLPTASSGKNEIKNDEHTTLTVTKKGDIYFNKEKIAMADLAPRLEEIKKTNSDPTIVLNADEETAYGRAIKVLDKVRGLGIKKVALQTKQS